MFRRIAVGLSIALAALLFLTQVVIPHSRKPKLGADADARQARLEKGREIIRRGCEAAGGMDMWRSTRDVSFRMNDQWHLAKSIWPQKQVETTQSILLHRNIAKIELHTGNGLHQWGLFENKPWALLNGTIDPDGLKRADYVIRNFSYFFELPFKFLDAGTYPEFVGEEIQDGRLFDKVYISFGLQVGKYPTDWYLALFDHVSGRMSSIIFTSVDKSPAFVEYRATFEDYQKVEALTIPTKVAVTMSRPVPGIKIHEWRLSDIRFDTGMAEALFQMPATAGRTTPATISMR